MSIIAELPNFNFLMTVGLKLGSNSYKRLIGLFFPIYWASWSPILNFVKYLRAPFGLGWETTDCITNTATQMLTLTIRHGVCSSLILAGWWWGSNQRWKNGEESSTWAIWMLTPWLCFRRGKLNFTQYNWPKYNKLNVKCLRLTKKKPSGLWVQQSIPTYEYIAEEFKVHLQDSYQERKFYGNLVEA